MAVIVRNAIWAGSLAGGLLFAGAFGCARGGAEDAAEGRRLMVEQQIIARGVKDHRVLDAMRSVPRQLFVPESLAAEAHGDYPLPIGHGQTISQPYIVALMTELLRVQPDHKILEIGTGSGYQAAILAHITSNVFTIEIVKELADEARPRLAKLGFPPERVICGDGYLGLPDEAPFDGIIVTAAPDHIPKPLVEQLKPGGRLVLPVGEVFGHQELKLIEKRHDGRLEESNIIPVRFVPLTGKAAERGGR
ncbi:MAG: protein-L-isoaspartate(D-aspartate) O-methyltransferase [Verrucomicrobiae bacterium]|nr:protein-L-isoaspartate(D-aspartate) O-methyltransferase [Verrucomicrobiae bacterium]